MKLYRLHLNRTICKHTSVSLLSLCVGRVWPFDLWWTSWQWRRNRKQSDPLMRRFTHRFEFTPICDQEYFMLSYYSASPTQIHTFLFSFVRSVNYYNLLILFTCLSLCNTQSYYWRCLSATCWLCAGTVTVSYRNAAWYFFLEWQESEHFNTKWIDEFHEIGPEYFQVIFHRKMEKKNNNNNILHKENKAHF